MASAEPGSTKMPVSRREFLQLSASALAGAAGLAGAGCTPAGVAAYDEPGWSPGGVRHILPTASHERLLVKASFVEPLDAPPVLQVGSQQCEGTAVGSTWQHFTFDQRGLTPSTAYPLRLTDAGGGELSDPWAVRTLPHPEASPDRMRILCFSCAGGFELTNPLTGKGGFQPMGIRRRLLARGLALEPDVAVANGDHFYWDLRAARMSWLTDGPLSRFTTGRFDRGAPVLGHANEDVVHAAIGPQIADLYGTLFRSVPTFFVRDDHDYGDNDEPALFPADAFMRDLASSTQQLYYPELIADSTMPRRVAGATGLSGHHGRLRYGDLFEALLYDCRGEMTRGPKEEEARFVAGDVEAWLVARSRASDARHLVHMPSTPILWSAGKWGEWYPDVLDEEGTLGTRAPKPEWPTGWSHQHDRLVRAAAARTDRAAVWVSGDLHSTAIGEIVELGNESLPQPVVSVLCGTPGTSGPGWPSAFRGTVARPSTTLTANEWLAPIEENGFSLLDVEPDRIVVSQFRWTEEIPLGAIAGLEPFLVREIPRPKA